MIHRAVLALYLRSNRVSSEGTNVHIVPDNTSLLNTLISSSGIIIHYFISNKLLYKKTNTGIYRINQVFVVIRM